MPARPHNLITEKRILRIILVIRGERVILVSDLAGLYGVEIRRLNKQVCRNIDKFLEYFMFQLTKGEFTNLKSQIAISSSGWGGPRKSPLCEHKRIAVKIVEDRGIESLKIMEVDG